MNLLIIDYHISLEVFYASETENKTTRLPFGLRIARENVLDKFCYLRELKTRDYNWSFRS